MNKILCTLIALLATSITLDAVTRPVVIGKKSAFLINKIENKTNKDLVFVTDPSLDNILMEFSESHLPNKMEIFTKRMTELEKNPILRVEANSNKTYNKSLPLTSTHSKGTLEKSEFIILAIDAKKGKETFSIEEPIVVQFSLRDKNTVNAAAEALIKNEATRALVNQEPGKESRDEYSMLEAKQSYKPEDTLTYRIDIVFDGEHFEKSRIEFVGVDVEHVHAQPGYVEHHA